METDSTAAQIQDASVAERGLPSSTAASESPVPSLPRLLSLDALRGFNMFWIIGGAEIVAEIANKVDNPTVSRISHNLTKHVEWEGFHFHDMIFPLFLFIIGVALPFSLGRRLDAGEPKNRLIRKVIWRTVILLALGWIYSGLLEFNGLQNLRIMGVLQRLALGYFFASIAMLYMNVRGQIVAAASCLVIYWLSMRFLSAPGFHLGDFSPNGNFANYIDRVLFQPGQIYRTYGDPEGIFSTIPAIATAMIGSFAGYYLRSDRNGGQKVRGLIAAGVLSIGAGYLWSIDFPVIKKIWTSSYVLVAGGWSLILLALFYWLIDVKGWKRGTLFFMVIGLNPITIYIGQEIIDFEHTAKFFVQGALKFIPAYEVLLFAASLLALKWLFLYFLHRQRIYLRV
jgi:predicted acyltransferase